MSYEKLHGRFRRIGDLNHALAILSWDEAAMMPAGGGAIRAESLATLSGLVHDMVGADETGELAEAALAEDLDDWETANVELIQRDWREARAVPRDLVVALSEAASSCQQAWRPARPANDWAAVSGPLETVLALTRQKAQALADALGCDPYDALLDTYQPGLTRVQVDPLFAQLRDVLPGLIDKAIDQQREPLPITDTFRVERQEALGKALMAKVGFDFERGLLGVSHHPFCGGEPDDTRITTRYNEADFLESMFAVLHETGHALYQQGLPKEWRGQPVGEANGMAVHESQSLLMEMQVCRGAAFLDFAAPIVQRSLLGAPTDAPEWRPDNLLRLAKRVRRGYIRVDSDELTYPLHVILRYELESALLDGSLAVADIPEAWHDKMSSDLGLSTVGNYRDGCMQDTHWFMGLIGYFPCYTLGAVIAAQLFATIRERVVGIDEAIRRGEFHVLVDWLRANIHGRGRLLPAMDLIAEVTGEPLGPDAFLAHLKARYLDAA